MKMKKTVLLGLMLVLGMMMTACGNEQPTVGDDLVIIVGKHANAYMYDDSATMGKISKALNSAVSTYKQNGQYVAELNVSVIVSDGKPKSVQLPNMTIMESNEHLRDQGISDLIKTVVRAIVEEGTLIRANDEQVDLAGALAEARRVLTMSENEKKRILILDTGVTTAGQIDMNKLDIFPKEMREKGELEAREFGRNLAQTQLPDSACPDLSGIRVIFLGLGNVAGDQEELYPVVKDGLLPGFWQAYLERCGAVLEEEIVAVPAGVMPMLYDEGGDGYPYVNTVPALSNRTELALMPASALGFKPSKDEFRDPDVAYMVIGEHIGALKEALKNEKVTLYVVGSVAQPQSGYNDVELSRKRAEKVAGILTGNFGIDEKRLVTVGAGTQVFPWRNAEETPGGTQANRVVAVIPLPVDSTASTELREAAQALTEYLREEDLLEAE